MEEKNAKITGTMLGIEDHGIFSFYLYLDYGGSSQGAGGYSLDTPIRDNEGKFLCRRGTAAGMELIARILQLVGVEKWEDLKGKSIRVEIGESGTIKAIGHIIKDDWFCPEKDFNTSK